jgi:predicted heme/steroid binding protein
MTLDELSKYDGVKSSKIMISVFNVVFDVTESEFYKQGSGYSVFAGKDCTVMLA